MREKCPYSEVFWSVFFCSLSVQMRQNRDQKTLNTDTFHSVSSSKAASSFVICVAERLSIWDRFYVINKLRNG